MQFKYKALNTKGGQVTGAIAAKDQRDAIRILKKQGLNVLEVKSQTKKVKSREWRKASTLDLYMYMHQLCTLLESRVSIEDSVNSLAESVGHESLRKPFENLAAGIRHGVSFSESLKKCGLNLPGYFYPLAEAGELTGKLGDSLRDALEQWDFDIHTASEFRNALTYPCILIVSGIGAVFLIFVVVVPKFLNLLKKTKGEIPFLAKAVLGTGQFVNDNLILVSIAFAGLMLLMAYAFVNNNARRALLDFASKLPMLKEWLFEAEIAKWSAMLSTLLGSRVALLKALELAQRYIRVTSLKARLTYVHQSVKNGLNLADALLEAGAITPMGFNLVQVGEKSGELPSMLRSLAKLYISSVRNRTKRFLVLIEPIAIILIGAVIGLIMAGIILAITSVNNISL